MRLAQTRISILLMLASMIFMATFISCGDDDTTPPTPPNQEEPDKPNNEEQPKEEEEEDDEGDRGEPKDAVGFGELREKFFHREPFLFGEGSSNLGLSVRLHSFVGEGLAPPEICEN